MILIFNYGCKNYKKSVTFKRLWINYSKELLVNLLQQEDWLVEDDMIQATWNMFENKVINIIDTIVPVTEFSSDSDCDRSVPLLIKQKNSC